LAQLLAVLIAALICMGTGWWLGYRSRQPDTVVLEPWPEEQDAPTPEPETTTQLEAARIAAANARHGLREAKEEVERLRKELEPLRARADDREAKLRIAERMLSQAQEARIVAVDAQIAAEERLNAARLEATSNLTRAQAELERWRTTAQAHGSALTQAEVELERLRAQVTHLEGELQATTTGLAKALAASAPSGVDVPDLSTHIDRERLRAQLSEALADRHQLSTALEEQRVALEAERDALHADLANALVELEDLRQRMYETGRRRAHG
jgi:chromosome segregation ATPase